MRFLGNKEQIKQKVSEYLSTLPEDKKLQVDISSPKRTNRQNRALHLFFDMIATALNDKNMFISRDLLKEEYETAWNATTVKELLWRPVQEFETGKQSSTRLTTKECADIADSIQRALAVKGIIVDFPSIEGEYLNNLQEIGK